MRQLLDLARENAALKCELTRIRQETEEIHRLLSGYGSASGASEIPDDTD